MAKRTKNKKYLPLYKKWLLSNTIPSNSQNGFNGGLCAVFSNDKNFKLLTPEDSELEKRPVWGYWGLDDLKTGVWASSDYFTPLRQNIVLFMAAMNNEL